MSAAAEPLAKPRTLGDFLPSAMLATVVVASAGLLLAVVIPLARDAMTDFLTVAIAVATALTLLSEIDTLHSWCGRYFLLRCGRRMTALMCLLAEYTSHPSDFVAMEPGVLGDASLCHAG